MYIAMGGERAANLHRPERSLLDHRVQLVIGEVAMVDPEHQVVTLADGGPLGYDQLVLATGSRIVPEAIEHFDTEAQHFYTAEAAPPAHGARRLHRRPDRRSASPGCPTSARRRRSRSPS